MRTLFITLAVLVTGCATTPRAKTAAQRLAEIKRERQAQAAGQDQATEQAGAPASQAESTPTSEAQVPPADEAPPPAPAAPEAPVAPEAPAAPEAPVAPRAPAAASVQPAVAIGPRMGLLGIRGTLSGSGFGLPSAALSVGSVSTVGVRYFFSDWVGVDLEAGFAIASVRNQTAVGLGLGIGLNLYGGTSEEPFRPYFAAGLGATSVSGGQLPNGESVGATAVSVSAGGGLEYWLHPRLSLNAGLLVTLSADPADDVLFFGTVRPGIGLTLYGK